MQSDKESENMIEELAQKIHSLLLTHQRFVLTTHFNPDGDGLGSEIAFFYYLRDLGKDVWILNQSPVPPPYRFLDPEGLIQTYDRPLHRQLVKEANVCLILDISDWPRLKQLGEDIRQADLVKICIDHHPVGGAFADIDLIVPEASSTGEIVYDLFRILGVPIDGPIADALYTAILTDTGSFRFANTTPKAHRIAAALLEKGVNHQRIYQLVYEAESPEKMWLLGQVLSNLHFECEGKLVWFVITQDMLHRAGLQIHELEGFADFPRRIQGVEVSLLLLELEDGRVKLSLRSRGNIAINQVASRFGGGGHPYASGAIVNLSLEELIPQLIAQLGEILSNI